MADNTLQLTLNSEQTLISRDIPSQRVLEISVHAPTMATQKSRPPFNLALVIDRSGSMSGESWNMSNRQRPMLLTGWKTMTAVHW